jgi:hypothetical protein
MEVPAYLKVLWAYKWLLLVGFVVALVAGFFAGYSVGPGGLMPRAVTSYTATNTIVVTSAKDTLYQAEVPAQKIREGYTAPQTIDLSNTAVIYAYIISGSKLRDTVAAQVGQLDPEIESVTAVRRTTQPGGNERFPGNVRLPVIDVIATAVTPERAETLATATTQAFFAYVTAEQDARHLSKDRRVNLQLTNVGLPLPVELANPNAPVVITAFGVLVAVIALIFAIHGIRTSRTRKRAARTWAKAAGGEPEGATTNDWVLPTPDEATETTALATETMALATEQGRATTNDWVLPTPDEATETTAAASEQQRVHASEWVSVDVLGGETDESSNDQAQFVPEQVSSDAEILMDDWNLYQHATAIQDSSSAVDGPSSGASGSPDAPVEAAAPIGRPQQAGMHT